MSSLALRVLQGSIGCAPQLIWECRIHEAIENKSAPSPPPVPDPTATANAQATANVDTAAAQAALGYVNQNTPYGSTNYSPTGSYTTPGGQTVPTYTQTTSLSPLGDQILQGEQGLAASIIPTAQNLADQAKSSATTPLNFDTPFSSTLNSSPQLLNQDAVNSVYGAQKGFLDPQWDEQQKQLQDQLSRQGIPLGSDAYNNAMKQFDNSKTQAYQSAQDTAIAQGTNNASQLFNLALSGQQANLGQQQLSQTNPISLLQQLLGSSPSTPSQPITTPSMIPIAPTDVIGAQGVSTNAAQQNYAAQAGQASAGNNAAVGAASAIAMAAAVAF